MQYNTSLSSNLLLLEALGRQLQCTGKGGPRSPIPAFGKITPLHSLKQQKNVSISNAFLWLVAMEASVTFKG